MKEHHVEVIQGEACIRGCEATEQQQAQLVQALREGRVELTSPWRDLAVPGLLFNRTGAIGQEH